jgi:hypothetical protein
MQSSSALFRTAWKDFKTQFLAQLVLRRVVYAKSQIRSYCGARFRFVGLGGRLSWRQRTVGTTYDIYIKRSTRRHLFSYDVRFFFFFVPKKVVSAFSGRGPTFDGRLKPDVVAPGTGETHDTIVLKSFLLLAVSLSLNQYIFTQAKTFRRLAPLTATI